jgi:anti-anti-sigma regulatory factor
MKLPFWLSLPLRLLAGDVHRPGQPLPPSEEASPPRPLFLRAPAEKRPKPGRRLEVDEVAAAEGMVVRIRGETGVAAAGALEDSLLRLVARRPACVTFDLSGLVFISDLAVGVVAAYRRAAVRAGARVRLAPDLRPAVREALDRAELTGLFENVARLPHHGAADLISSSRENRRHHGPS